MTTSINTCFSPDTIVLPTTPTLTKPNASSETGETSFITLSPDNLTAQARAGYVEKDDGDLLVLTVPEGTQSIALTVEGGGDNVIVVSTLQSPSGGIVWDFMEDIGVNKTSPDSEPYTFLLPSNTTVEMEPGEWLLKLMTDAPSGKTVDLRAFYKSGPVPDQGTLDLNLFFVGLDDLNAENAKQNQSFIDILTGAETIFKSAGISFGKLEFIDIAGDNGKKFRVTNAFDGELTQLFQLSAGAPEGALNFFFVGDLEGDAAGFSLLGMSGGVPGPPGVHGTAKSGVVVNMADFKTDPRTIEIVMAHEAAHYLGLFHTTERNGSSLDELGIVGFDPLCDTRLCPDVADNNTNLVLSRKECTDFDGNNLMFSLATHSSRTLSAAQGQILRRNFLIK